MRYYNQEQYHYRLLEAKYELARNFYDDYEFCPVPCSNQVLEHCERIQQRLFGPQQQTSPPASSPKNKAIPIIDPSNMTPVLYSKQVLEHCESIQQRFFFTPQKQTSPGSSDTSSLPGSSYTSSLSASYTSSSSDFYTSSSPDSRTSSLTVSPKIKAIPIIDPSSMTPVNITHLRPLKV